MWGGREARVGCGKHGRVQVGVGTHGCPPDDIRGAKSQHTAHYICLDSNRCILWRALQAPEKPLPGSVDLDVAVGQATEGVQKAAVSDPAPEGQATEAK